MHTADTTESHTGRYAQDAVEPSQTDNAGLWVLGAVIILIAVCATAPGFIYAAIRRWV
jgi:hypothetical protein